MPQDINGVICLLQLIATTRQLKIFLDKEEVLKSQIKAEIETRKLENERAKS